MKLALGKSAQFRSFAPFVLVASLVSTAAGEITSITPLSNPSSFNPGSTLLTFAGLAPFAEPTNVGSVGFLLSNGHGPDVASDPTPAREYGPTDPAIIQNLASGFLDMNIYFNRSVSQVGFEMRAWPSGTINLSFFSAGALLQTASVATRTTNGPSLYPYLFYGFQSSTAFDQVLVAVRGPDPYGEFFAMDNLRFSAVPEPAVPTLLIGGLVLHQIVRCRTRRCKRV